MIFTPIKLDKMRNIVLGFKAMQEFKNITGKSLTKLDFEDENLEVETIVPVIFYAGLKHEDGDLTLEKTIELLDGHLGLKGAIDLIPKIMEDAFGKIEIENK